MATRIIEALAVPAMGAIAALGAAFAASDAFEPAYGEQLSSLEIVDAAAWAGESFDRTDTDGNGLIDANEFSALSIVTAELAHLNGFLHVNAQIIALPIEAPTAISSVERARISAIASREFYIAAGDDSGISKAEFVNHKLEKFHNADRNRNGVLNATELKYFAVAQTRINLGRA